MPPPLPSTRPLSGPVSNMVAGKESRPPITFASGDNAASPNLPPSLPANPSLDDNMWTAVVRDMFVRARAHRRPRVTQWLRNYRILNSRTWSTSRPGYMPDPEVNELSDVIDSWVGWVTDQRPQIQTASYGQPSSPYAGFLSQLGDDLGKTMMSVSENEDYGLAVEQVVADALTYGVGYFKTSWDPLAVGGLGDAVMRRVDPFSLYPDPNATCDDDLSYLVEARTLSMAEVERRFGRKVAESLQETGFQEDIDEAPNTIKGVTEQAKAIPGNMIAGPTPNYGQPGQSRRHVTDTPGVTILEAWIREFDEYEVNGVMCRYTVWRCVVVSGNHVLFNELATDMWHHGDHPYTPYRIKERGEWFNPSLVEILTPIQLSINRLLAAIEHNIWLHGNPVFKEDARAGLARTKMTNAPGQRLMVNGANSVAEWLQPPQMHPALTVSLVQFYVDRMQKISGLAAMAQGQLPPGRNSTESLDDVQEGSFVKIRVGLRNLERALRRSYSLAASLVVEFYDGPRIMAIIGPGGEKSALALKAKHFYLPTPDGDGRSLPMRFSLTVDAGSEVPTSRLARSQEADVLFAMGAIDGQAVLEAHKWPGAAAITARVQQGMADGSFQPPGARQRTQRTQ